MAVQQNKKSPSKRGMHRSHNALTVPGIAVEPTTGEFWAPELNITALVTSSLGNVNLHKNGMGQLRLGANNTYTGSTVINSGTLQVDGSQPASSVIVQDGRLAGHGRVGHRVNGFDVAR